RGTDQRVRPGGDLRPAHRLGGRGRLERRLEPAPDWAGEGRQGVLPCRRRRFSSSFRVGCQPSDLTDRPDGGLGDSGSGQAAAVLALVVRAVLAGANRPPPRLVVPVPPHGPLEAVCEPHPWLPPERAGPLRGKRVATVVAEAI